MWRHFHCPVEEFAYFFLSFISQEENSRATIYTMADSNISVPSPPPSSIALPPSISLSATIEIAAFLSFFGMGLLALQMLLYYRNFQEDSLKLKLVVSNLAMGYEFSFAT